MERNLMSIIYWDTTPGYIYSNTNTPLERDGAEIQSEEGRFRIHAITEWSMAAFALLAPRSSRVEPDGIRDCISSMF